MPYIHLFEVPRAYASWMKDRLVVSLYYPLEKGRQYVQDSISKSGRLPFGVDALTQLNTGLQTPIATDAVPTRPASAGILDVLADGRIVVHRRDKKTTINPLHHGVPCGYPTEEDHHYDLGLLARKESAEELIYVTRDKKPWVIVPKEGDEQYDKMVEHFTLNSAERLGLDASKKKYERVRFKEGPDEVEIYVHEPAQTSTRRFTRIGSTYGFVYLSWLSEHSIALAQIRHWHADPANMLPLDTEGDYSEGRQGHFNREVFVLDPKKLSGVEYGSVLPEGSYQIYRLGRHQESGEPTSVLQIQLENPPVFMPDDGLTRMLDALGVEGYAGRWMGLEIERMKKRLEGTGKD